MTIDIKHFPELNLVVFAPRGTFSADDVRKAIIEFFRDDADLRKSHALWDLREGAALAFSLQDIKELAEMMQELFTDRAESLTAIVAPQDLEFGLSRMLSQFTAPRPGPIRVFQDYQAARDWLSKKEPQD